MDISAISNAPLPTKEHMLGKGLLMPFNPTNSGTRKLMFGGNLEQRLDLVDPDVPYIQTGYERQFGEFSSSFITADSEYQVVAIIPKFSAQDRHIYTLIMRDMLSNKLIYTERTTYRYITETFGYMQDNTEIDNMKIGTVIPKGTPLSKSNSFDEYNNRKDGKNLVLKFNSSDDSIEDAIIVSETCARKMTSPLFHKVKIVVNSNDIPLNIYGDNDNYKILPDIGEHIVDGLLCSLRREKKEEALYSQSFSRLSTPTISDEKITVTGQVVDIDIYCNDPVNLVDNPYCGQLYRYYSDHMRFCKNVVDIVDEYTALGYNMDYELQKLYSKSIGEINGKQFFNERVFSNIIIEVTVMHVIPLEEGDKLTNRYGGKGVISKVVPDHLMPITEDGLIVDIEANLCGVYGRENGGQLFEASFNFISRKLSDFIGSQIVPIEGKVAVYLEYLNLVAPKMARETEVLFDTISDEELIWYMGSINAENMIYLDIDPVSETPSLDLLATIYKTFPFLKQENVFVPLKNSNGDYVMVNSHRPTICGHVYYYRLKQHGEEKFSVTSLSATNIKNENSRNKDSKSYKAKFSRTPIRFGDMEIGNMIHMGSDLIVEMLMLYSTSPQGRLLCESLMTGDPFRVDVKIDDQASNRNVEILNTYLKTLGLRIEFIKKRKKAKHPILFSPIMYVDEVTTSPIIFYHPDEVMDTEAATAKALANKNVTHPIMFSPIVYFEDPELLDEYGNIVEVDEK